MRVPILLLTVCAATTLAADLPILNTAHSPKAVLHGVPVSAVRLGTGFWTPRLRVNEEVSLPTLLQLFETNGIIDNFRRVSGHKDVPRRGPLYTDSDVYKWLEAVGFVLQTKDNPELRKSAEAVIDEIAAAQEPSGYINTYFTKEHLAERHQNMRGGHELYCLGHLIQAGIAWQRATGERKLLDVGIRMIEYLIKNFGPGKQPIYEGHPEMELASIELYRTTGDRRYLNFAGYLLGGDERNRAQLRPSDVIYLFTAVPFTSRTKLEGHAVRAMYACSGATDYYLETGEESYRQTLANLWEDMTRRKQYLTGGVGSRAAGEAFGEPYELPNQQAYTESCAAIGTMFWNWRMMQADPKSQYMNNFERALYNGANSGLSLAGNLYCYRNPLELTGNPDDKIRNPWYDTTCCPPNLQRILASLPGYFYSTSKEGLWVHLFHNSTLDWKLEDGTPVRLRQATEYPWKGRVEFTVEPASAREFTLFIRRPSWSGAPRITVAGGSFPNTMANGYYTIRRTWKPGDRVVLDMDVSPRLTVANPYLREDLGKVAVERGPLVYAMEGIDQPGGSSVFDWTLDLRGQDPKFSEEWKPDLLGGIQVLKVSAWQNPEPGTAQPLYFDWNISRARTPQRGQITLIPYYTFHNREITSMQVWIPYR
jgi:DUF1680 family protein